MNFSKLLPARFLTCVGFPLELKAHLSFRIYTTSNEVPKKYLIYPRFIKFFSPAFRQFFLEMHSGGHEFSIRQHKRRYWWKQSSECIKQSTHYPGDKQHLVSN